MNELPAIDPGEVDQARRETYVNIIRNLTEEVAVGQALAASLQRENTQLKQSNLLQTQELEHLRSQLQQFQLTAAPLRLYLPAHSREQLGCPSDCTTEAPSPT